MTGQAVADGGLRSSPTIWSPIASETHSGWRVTKHDDAVGVGVGAEGVEGNERLTAIAGALILILAVAEVVTVPAVAQLLSLHFVVGVLMLGPVVVKTGSTLWRFARYYTGSPAYRRKGAPRLLLRVLSPILLIATIAAIGSGIGLAITGPAPEALLAVHKASFIVWLVTIVVHLVAYVWRVPKTIEMDWAPTSRVRGRDVRVAVNIVAIACAAVGAALLTPLDRKWPQWFAQQTESGLGIKVLIVFLMLGLGIACGRRVWTPSP